CFGLLTASPLSQVRGGQADDPRLWSQSDIPACGGAAPSLRSRTRNRSNAVLPPDLRRETRRMGRSWMESAPCIDQPRDFLAEWLRQTELCRIVRSHVEIAREYCRSRNGT